MPPTASNTQPIRDAMGPWRSIGRNVKISRTRNAMPASKCRMIAPKYGTFADGHAKTYAAVEHQDEQKDVCNALHARSTPKTVNRTIEARKWLAPLNLEA